MVLKINPIVAKTILTKSGLPGSDWVINPYNGCLFGCMYCYAAQIARWKHPKEKWGTYLDIKTNAPDLLKIELAKIERKLGKKDFGFIFLSSVTDPYVGLEAKYKLTRQCLEALSDFGYEGGIGIQTKSGLVTRDIDVIKKLKNATVGFTVTSLDDKVSKFLEVFAPPVSVRINAIRELAKRGVNTYAMIGPILPHFVNNEKILNQLLDELQDAGVKEVWFEHINLRGPIKERLYNYLLKESPNLVPIFEKSDTKEYRRRLDAKISKAMSGRKLRMGLGKVIYHHDLPKKSK
jgi:DNA repair photolyase